MGVRAMKPSHQDWSQSFWLTGFGCSQDPFPEVGGGVAAAGTLPVLTIVMSSVKGIEVPAWHPVFMEGMWSPQGTRLVTWWLWSWLALRSHFPSSFLRLLVIPKGAHYLFNELFLTEVRSQVVFSFHPELLQIRSQIKQRQESPRPTSPIQLRWVNKCGQRLSVTPDSVTFTGRIYEFCRNNRTREDLKNHWVQCLIFPEGANNLHRITQWGAEVRLRSLWHHEIRIFLTVCIASGWVAHYFLYICSPLESLLAPTNPGFLMTSIPIPSIPISVSGIFQGKVSSLLFLGENQFPSASLTKARRWERGLVVAPAWRAPPSSAFIASLASALSFRKCRGEDLQNASPLRKNTESSEFFKCDWRYAP